MSKDKENKMIINEIDGLALAKWIHKVNNIVGLESDINNILMRVDMIEVLLIQEKMNDFTRFIIRKMLYNKASDQIWSHMRVRETDKEREERIKKEKEEKNE